MQSYLVLEEMNAAAGVVG